MPYEVVMPQLGLSMESGKILHWFKRSGEPVKPGEVLLEVESDKAAIQVEAVGSGILEILCDDPALDLPVGTVIGRIIEPEAAPALRPDAPSAPPATLPSPAVTEAPLSSSPTISFQEQAPRPRKIRSSPSARRVAAELGVDWQAAQGTGPAGRIKKSDIRRLAESRIVAPSISPTTAEGLRSAARRRPMEGLRRRIAERMVQSAHTTAAVTLTTEANATELVRLREEQKADSQIVTVPSYNALFAKLVSRALLEHPDLNATLDGAEIVQWEAVHIGIAVETERGLVVPVLRDVDSKTLRVLAHEMDELLAHAAAGHATPDDLQGSTFTITNLGAFDIDAFTPIINPPECAILGIGRIHKKMVVIEDAAAIAPMVALSLTFDHRIVDGVPAARFLRRVKEFVEHPYLWLTA